MVRYTRKLLPILVLNVFEFSNSFSSNKYVGMYLSGFKDFPYIEENFKFEKFNENGNINMLFFWSPLKVKIELNKFRVYFYFR